MLSRVAEGLYWMARYLERAENNARMIMAFNSLALDMPKETQLSWKGLVAVTGMGALFDQHHQKADERNCVKFLMADSYNPSSIASCIKAARENVRTTRDQVPTDAWEVINELYRYIQEHIDQGVGKRARYEFLNEIVGRCQMLNGLLAGCMSHDEGYDFIRVGRNLERADMATRQIEVGALQFLDGWDGTETAGYCGPAFCATRVPSRCTATTCGARSAGPWLFASCFRTSRSRGLCCIVSVRSPVPWAACRGTRFRCARRCRRSVTPVKATWMR